MNLSDKWFNFKGSVEVSKSWMNRALILQSYFSDLNIEGESQADDVQLLKVALKELVSGQKEFYAGLGGTTFRFLALRLSREVGTFHIKIESALRDRPQNEIVDVLKQVGVESYFDQNTFVIISSGWKFNKSVEIDVSRSSQFISAFLLNSFNLEKDIYFHFKSRESNADTTPKMKSEDYWLYTLNLVNKIGLKVFEKDKEKFHVLPLQKPNVSYLKGEVDVSSAFSLISAGLLTGKVEINNWKKNNLQPDYAFLNFFQQMNIQFNENDEIFKIEQQENYNSIEANIGQCPDLFPVLAVVCAFANGKSKLFGAPQLVHKESNRIQKTCELLEKCGFQVEAKDDGAIIYGEPKKQYLFKNFIDYDEAHDHRMAFAAALLILKGFPIRIKNPQAINKSYPQFFQHIGLHNL